MNKLYLGILSGTSMDAIDIAAVDFNAGYPKIIASLSTPITAEYKNTYRQIINSGQCTVQQLGEIDHLTGQQFANAVLKFLDHSNIAKKDITAIGSHGQTLWHAPDATIPFTMQIGDPNIIAVRSGITTVADFRRADIAAGGKGAPFAPAFHQEFFSSPTEARCILNVGGISNVSLLANNTVFGFDPGPGNCLMDLWTKKHFNIEYDKDGEIAQTGTYSPELLRLCLNDPYFSKAAPKSTGIEYFNEQWLSSKIEKLNTHLIATDILATLLQLTAQTVANAIQNSNCPTAKVYMCGGGAKNHTLVAELSKLLASDVKNTKSLGIDPDWMECALFAWLAKQTVSGQAVNLTTITGASKPVILGGIYAAEQIIS
jgi:anhydro-N-acetylmuramic acid kinase